MSVSYSSLLSSSSASYSASSSFSQMPLLILVPPIRIWRLYMLAMTVLGSELHYSCFDALLFSVFCLTDEGVGLMTRPLWKWPLNPFPMPAGRTGIYMSDSYRIAPPFKVVILTGSSFGD